MTNQTFRTNTATQLASFVGDTPNDLPITEPHKPSSSIPSVSDFYPSAPQHLSGEKRKEVIRDLESALKHVPLDDRVVWIAIVYALKSLEEDGYQVLLSWSKASPLFNQADTDRTWRTINNPRSDYTSIFKMAAGYGWVNHWKGHNKSTRVAVVSEAGISDPTSQLDREIVFPDLNAQAKPTQTIENAEALLSQLGITYYFDEMIKERVFNIPGVCLSDHNQTNNAIANIKSMASKHGLGRDPTVENAMTLADNKLYHPARAWIECKPWDGVSRYAKLFNSLDPINRDVAHMLLLPWLISCIAALYKPKGVAAQGVLILQGKQGCGKTTWLKRLCGDHPEFFREGLIFNPSNKDSVKLSITRWIAEFGELGATFKKADIEELKAFTTKDEDELRLPYAVSESKWPRRSVFCGSVNDDEFLNDATGNRRFWVIPVNNPQPFHLLDMQQVWAEVKSWYDNKASWVLTREQLALLNASNEKHAGVCPIEELIRSEYDWDCVQRSNAQTITEICHRIEILGTPTRAQMRAVGKAVRTLLEVDGPRKTNGSSVYDMPKIRVPKGY